MLKLALYVDGSRVELFQDIGITVKDSIKTARDVGTVFTAYSQQFRVPASAKNNIIFKHFDRPQIRNGFDARRKHTALIQVNGADFQKGFVKLLGADIKNGAVDAYRLQFTGELSGLKEILGDDLIGDLDYLDIYDHEFDESTVRDGFEDGLFDGVIKYPFLSHTRGFKYTTADGMFDLTQTGTVAADDRLKHSDLKPAIQVREILVAMEQKYDISFKRTPEAGTISPDGGEFIDEEPFKSMYLWCHKNKGGIVTDDPTTNVSQWQGTIEDLNLDTFTSYGASDPADGSNIEIYDQDDGTDDQWDKSLNLGSPVSKCQAVTVDPDNIAHVIAYKSYQGTENKMRYECDVTVTPSGGFTADYNLFVWDDINNLYWVSEQGLNGASGTISFDIEPPNEQPPRAYNINILVTSDTLDEFDIDMNFTGYRDTFCTSEFTRSWAYSKTVSAAELITEAKPKFNLPKMKCIDLLRAIFSMFNCVAYPVVRDIVSQEYDIVIKPLDRFYSEGKTHDITKLVDHESGTVDKVNPFAAIEFKYEEPSTLLATKGNEETSREFGNLKWRVEQSGSNEGGFLYDGGEYTVDVPLEKMQFARMQNDTTGNNTPIQWGWFVNDFSENEPEPELGKPLFMFIVSRSLGGQTIEWFDTTTSSVMNAPSNVNTDGSQTLHFGAEFDEYTLDTNENSLFENYYATYINGIFNRDARRRTVTAYLPAGLMLNYKLNDRIVISDVQYSIDTISIDTLTGKTKLQLNKITGLYDAYDVLPSFAPCYAEDGYVEEDYWCLPFDDGTLGDDTSVDLPTESLIAYYKFNGNADDATTNNLDGTATDLLFGTHLGLRTGVFNGTSTDVIVADDDLLSFGNSIVDDAFSVSFFVRRNDSTGSEMAITKSGGSNFEYAILLTGSGLNIRLYDADSVNYLGEDSTNSISWASWKHVIVTYDLVSIKCYIDGSEIALTNADVGSYTAMHNTSETLKIGVSGFSTAYLDGELQGLAIWDKALSSEEAEAIYNYQNEGNELI